jgi:soluble lytic murein transglycosylase
VADLQGQFGGDPYKAVAAYNAGPRQVQLWQRLAPGPGDDVFLSTVNFDETKEYVRRVMTSYTRYREIYGDAAAPRPAAEGIGGDGEDPARRAAR